MRIALTLLLFTFAAAATGAQRVTGVIESFTASVEAGKAPTRMRVVYPTARGRHPIIVLSQGARATPLMYDRLAQHWATRGFVVLQPMPPELAPIGDPRVPATRRLPGAVQARMDGIRTTLAALDQLESRARPLRGRLDRERIAVAGHSLGGLAALLATGARLTYLDGTAVPPGEPAIDAVLLIGDPRHTGIVPEGAWRAARVPVLLATGDLDAGEAQAAGQRMQTVFAVADAADPQTPARHELFVRGMDACLGGLLCRATPGTTADMAALFAIAEVSTTFLTAYLREDAAALAWLRGDAPADLANGRAALRAR